MPDVQIMPAALTTQVEGFPPKGAEGKPFQRSCEGALHLRPGSTRVITDDELGFVRQHNPRLARFIRVLVNDDVIKAVSAKEAGSSKADDVIKGKDGKPSKK